jgi:spermidine/putrescine transport system substrate-binding protein
MNISTRLALFLISILFFSCIADAKEKEVVNFYNWANYTPKPVIRQFEKETGIKVNYSEYENNETLYTKLKTHGHGDYDLVVPSSYFVDKMRKQNMLEKLDKNKLPNLKNINPAFLNPAYDPGNNFSVPYLWTATGIVVNTSYFPRTHIDRWANFWQPFFNNQLLLVDDIREVFAIALIRLGYSVNDTNPEHIKQAYEKLQELMPNIKLFNIDSIINAYVDEEVAVGMGWNGDIYKATQENKHLQFIYPLDGFTLSVDNLVIPKSAPHLENAYKLLNFLLRPEIAVQISQATGYPTPNSPAMKSLPLQMRQSPLLNPDPATISRGQFLLDVGRASEIYSKYWEALKTGA